MLSKPTVQSRIVPKSPPSRFIQTMWRQPPRLSKPARSAAPQGSTAAKASTYDRNARMESATTNRHQLIRAIGRWSLVALVVNCIIGSGAFGLPSAVAALLGRASVLAVLLAGAAIAIVMACFADVASQFTDPGGSLPLRAHW